MRTLATIFMFLFALNVTAVVHAEDGSMRYRQMVENLREQNKERREARDQQTIGGGDAGMVQGERLQEEEVG